MPPQTSKTLATSRRKEFSGCCGVSPTDRGRRARDRSPPPDGAYLIPYSCIL
jgi:hypothetical protein